MHLCSGRQKADTLKCVNIEDFAKSDWKVLLVVHRTKNQSNYLNVKKGGILQGFTAQELVTLIRV